MAPLSRTIWPIFSSEKACKISQQIMRNSENIGHTVLGTVQ